MHLSQYQQKALQTAGSFEDSMDALNAWTLALNGEAGELANKVKKILWHGHELRKEALLEEVGDCLWYLAALADCLGTNLDQVAIDNLTKLRGRYPQGFSHADSVNRKENENVS